MRQTFKMQDYDIMVDYGPHEVSRLYSRFSGIDTCYLDFIFEGIFTNKDVGEYLINDVRIGEEVVVIDEDSRISFALNVGTDCFFVKTLFNAYEGNLLIGEMQKVLRLAKARGLRIEEFTRQRSESYA